MRTRTGRWTARIDRRRRSCGFDRNDLRRDVDRVQWRLGLLLLVVFLSATPPLLSHAVQSAYGSGVRAERQQAATRHRVEATIVKVRDPGGRRTVTVAWTDPDGTRRTGDYTTWRGADVGERLLLWAGPDGVSITPPRRHAQTVIHTTVAGAGVALATGLPVLCLYWLVRVRYDRRRYRLWDAEWARLDNHRIGP
ncbi:Rv1733c family protein [Actinomadura mexicana]|uniref:Uncharacterized protein n=1 Tax=Actinomadura mexicana TaxID=134959 RepID=A0A239BV92_9ACTN|nr:hypothetical protein [Actinomadura mexicana]SNS11338.1 hypothetical protein SAMN06265355_111104 [Actinomadura mexicana]